jgi:hypothetical protein
MPAGDTDASLLAPRVSGVSVVQRLLAMSRLSPAGYNGTLPLSTSPEEMSAIRSSRQPVERMASGAHAAVRQRSGYRLSRPRCTHWSPKLPSTINRAASPWVRVSPMSTGRLSARAGDSSETALWESGPRPLACCAARRWSAQADGIRGISAAMRSMRAV